MHTPVRPAPRTHVARPGATATSTVAALGVVFGDIGTSPLYAIQIVFALDGGVVRPTSQGVYGVVTARSANVPRVHPEDRVTVDDLGYTDDDITRVTARFGFQEEPDIPEALRLATAKGLECDIDLDGSTYFLSRATIRVTDAPGMERWRKRVFVAIWRNAANPVEYFHLPDRRTITMGWQTPL